MHPGRDEPHSSRRPLPAPSRLPGVDPCNDAGRTRTIHENSVEARDRGRCHDRARRAPRASRSSAQGASAAPVPLRGQARHRQQLEPTSTSPATSPTGTRPRYWESINNAVPAVGPGGPRRRRDRHRPHPQDPRAAGAPGRRPSRCRARTDGSSFTHPEEPVRVLRVHPGQATPSTVDVTDTQRRATSAPRVTRQLRLARRAAVRGRGLRHRRPRHRRRRRPARTGSNLAQGRPDHRDLRASRPTSPATRSTAPPPPTGRVRPARTRRTSRCRSRAPVHAHRRSSSSSTRTPPGATGRRRSPSRAARAAAPVSTLKASAGRTRSARRPATR